jgi:hypothetical protein
MKKILLIFAATSSLFTQEYDPYTGKPIRLPTKNIFTGQIQENETIPTVKLVKVELKSEETVSGELIQEKNTFIIIKNEVLGILQIEKNKIAEMYESAGVDYSVKKANSTKSAAASARNSAYKNKKILKNNINSIQCLKYLNF